MMNMPKKPRKTRVDSFAGVSAAIAAGGKKIHLPPSFKLNKDERTAFTEICNEFSKSELTAHKTTMAAILAQQVTMLHREQIALMSEGSTIINNLGSRRPNPRAQAVGILTGAILSIRRSLGLQARLQNGGNIEAVAIRRAHNKANETMLDAIDTEGLLARPPIGHDDDD
jgi:hypothetical protein